MTKKELQIKVYELEKENGLLARSLVKAEADKKRFEAASKHWGSQAEVNWGYVEKARSERDEAKDKCKKCGLYERFKEMDETIGTQSAELQRWRKFTELMREAGWALEFD